MKVRLPEIHVSPELAAEVRAETERLGCSYTAFATKAIEALLAGDALETSEKRKTRRRRGAVSRALERALHDVRLEIKDMSAVELARYYAAIMDQDVKEGRRVVPLLLDVLTAMGMTPRSRFGVVEAGDPEDVDPVLVDLTARAQRRASQ
jgi:hypothetical protein